MSRESGLDVLIRTGLASPIAINLAEQLLQEAGIHYFTMDQNPAARQDCAPSVGYWDIRVSREREAEAREILRSIEEAGQDDPANAGGV